MLNGRSDVFLAKLVARGDLEKNVLARQPRDDLINGKKKEKEKKGKTTPALGKNPLPLIVFVPARRVCEEGWNIVF